MVNSDINSHLDKCLSEPGANAGEVEGPSVSEPPTARATVDEDELSEGCKDFHDESSDEIWPEKENIESTDTTPTGSQASKPDDYESDDDVLARTLRLEPPSDRATRIKTRAAAAASVESRYCGINGIIELIQGDQSPRFLDYVDIRSASSPF